MTYFSCKIFSPRFFLPYFTAFFFSFPAFSTPSHFKPLMVYIHETLYVTQKEVLTKLCDFPIILKSFSGSDLVGQLLLEKDTLKADVVVGLEGERSTDPRITSLATPLPPMLLQKPALPFSWKNQRFLPISYAYLTFLYDKRHITPSLQTLKSFLKSLPPKSLVMADPRTSMVGQGGLFWMDSSDYELLHQKVLTYPKGWSGAFALFNGGRAKVMLGYTTSLLYHHEKGCSFVKAASFNTTAHPIQVMTAFVVNKKKRHPKAFVFLKVLLSKALQKTVIKNYAYPVIDIPLPQLHKKNRPKKTFLLTGGKHQKSQNLNKWMAAGYKKLW